MKKCRRCGEEKELLEYYKHKQMFDGHLNICKECTKKRVGKHREKNIDRIREYDRNRPNKEKRYKETSIRDKIRRKKYPLQCYAQTWIGNAIRDNRVKRPKNCSWCNSESNRMEGHHEDYQKPKEVVWLCNPCHKTLHQGKSEKAEEMRKKIKIPILE